MKDLWKDLLFDKDLLAVQDIHGKIWVNAQEVYIKLGFWCKKK